MRQGHALGRKYLLHLVRSFAADGSDASVRRILEVGLIGVPNAGKSELTNCLVGRKVTAVSSKKNTTTQCQLGGYISGRNTQIVLYDLPGVLRPTDSHYKGQLARVQGAWSAVELCSVITFIVDAALIVRHLKKGMTVSTMIKANPVFDLAQKLEEERTLDRSKKIVLALNKIDLVPPSGLPVLNVVEELFRERCEFERRFLLSALNGKNVQELKSYFHMNAQRGDWVLPPGLCSDKSPGQLAVEFVRENLFRRLNKELPYRVETQLVQEDVTESGDMFFEIVVRVPNENSRKIVIGSRGNVIEDYIIARARRDLENTFKRKILLNVTVKAKSY